MDDLISRSALLAAYDKAHQGPPGGARKLIAEAPDAIVRCKDCKFWETGNKAIGEPGVYGWCRCEGFLENKILHRDWYCPWGGND